MTETVDSPTIRTHMDWLDHRIDPETDAVRALRYSEDRDPFYGREPEWCEDAVDGHWPEAKVEDRNHFSRRIRVDASLMDGEPQGDGTVVPATFDAYMVQNVQHVQPKLWIGVGESANGFWLTLVEALDLFQHCTELIGDNWAQVVSR